MKTQKTKKPTLKHLTLSLATVEDVKYKTDDLVNILSEIPFDKINISLSAKKSYLGLTGMGYTNIGFVNSFNADDCTFEVAVFENRTEAIEKLGDIALTVRAFTNKEGKLVKVIGLDVEPLAE